MKKLIILFSMAVLASCGSTNVSIPTRSQYAPSDYKPAGVVKYLNNGADSVIARRKEDAFKTMYSNCNGEYRITGEGPKEENGVVTAISPNSYMASSFSYWYISYECLN